MRLPVGFVKKHRLRLAGAVIVGLFLAAGGSAAAALALLPANAPGTAAEGGSRALQRPDLARARASATAAPTRLVGRRAARRPRLRRSGPAYYRKTASLRVAASTGQGFVPLYREAARAFTVPWQLIASIHRQETAFSTVKGTYRGLNAFGCCAGPMQFNVTNGPVSTWELYRQSFRRGDRPGSYPHKTRFHPSIYDDFDAIMAAGALLSDGGATEALDGGSWSAAYAYYGHDLFGVGYASQVMGRATGWARDGFCPNCALDEALVAEFDDAYGVDARRELRATERDKKKAKKKKRKKDRGEKADKKASEKRERRKDPRRPSARKGAPAASAPTRTQPPTTNSPQPPTATPPRTTPPPAATTQAPPQPTTPPPAEPCTPFSSLLGCTG